MDFVKFHVISRGGMVILNLPSRKDKADSETLCWRNINVTVKSVGNSLVFNLCFNEVNGCGGDDDCLKVSEYSRTSNSGHFYRQGQVAVTGRWPLFRGLLQIFSVSACKSQTNVCFLVLKKGALVIEIQFK